MTEEILLISRWLQLCNGPAVYNRVQPEMKVNKGQLCTCTSTRSIFLQDKNQILILDLVQTSA